MKHLKFDNVGISLIWAYDGLGIIYPYGLNYLYYRLRAVPAIVSCPGRMDLDFR